MPLVLDPIPAIYHQDWFGKGVEQDGTDAYGVYQNGSICHFHLYYLFQALYGSGLRKQAPFPKGPDSRIVSDRVREVKPNFARLAEAQAG